MCGFVSCRIFFSQTGSLQKISNRLTLSLLGYVSIQPKRVPELFLWGHRVLLQKCVTNLHCMKPLCKREGSRLKLNPDSFPLLPSQLLLPPPHKVRIGAAESRNFLVSISPSLNRLFGRERRLMYLATSPKKENKPCDS